MVTLILFKNPRLDYCVAYSEAFETAFGWNTRTGKQDKDYTVYVNSTTQSHTSEIERDNERFQQTLMNMAVAFILEQKKGQ